jgi:phasin family protein
MTAQIMNWQPTAEAMSKTVQAGSQFLPGNLEALKQSRQACLAGMQDFSRLYVSAVQGLVQQAVDGTKAFAGAKTPQELVAVQMDLGRAAMERMASEGTKLQHSARTMVQQIYAPLTQRATAVVEQVRPSQAA